MSLLERLRRKPRPEPSAFERFQQYERLLSDQNWSGVCLVTNGLIALACEDIVRHHVPPWPYGDSEEARAAFKNDVIGNVVMGYRLQRIELETEDIVIDLPGPPEFAPAAAGYALGYDFAIDMILSGRQIYAPLPIDYQVVADAISFDTLFNNASRINSDAAIFAPRYAWLAGQHLAIIEQVKGLPPSDRVERSLLLGPECLLEYEVLQGNAPEIDPRDPVMQIRRYLGEFRERAGWPGHRRPKESRTR